MVETGQLRAAQGKCSRLHPVEQLCPPRSPGHGSIGSGPCSLHCASVLSSQRLAARRPGPAASSGGSSFELYLGLPSPFLGRGPAPGGVVCSGWGGKGGAACRCRGGGAACRGRGGAPRCPCCRYAVSPSHAEPRSEPRREHGCFWSIRI